MSEESSVAAQQLWKKKYELGCEWCGQKYPSIATKTNAGYATYGLEFCHIFAGVLGTAHEWNGFILCPHCHTIFDKVLKPKLQTAFTKAITGFGDPPTNPKKPYCVASTYRGCVEALIKRSGAAANELPGASESSLIPWSSRT